MKTIKSSRELTTLELGDKVVFGDLEYEVAVRYGYFIYLKPKDIGETNDKIFRVLNISERNFVENLGINILPISGSFPETKSLEALTALVSALFKEFEKQNELPKTWEEFCEKNPAEDEYYISNHSCIICVKGSRNPNSDKNLCTSKQEAEAHIALMQLRQLRKAYVKDWEPNWMDDKTKFVLNRTYDTFYIYDTSCTSCTLSFPTYELAEQFLTNFKDLLEIAKPLL